MCCWTGEALEQAIIKNEPLPAAGAWWTGKVALPRWLHILTQKSNIKLCDARFVKVCDA